MITGHGKRLRRVLQALAERTETGSLSIPGVASAADDLAAIVALKEFEILLYKTLAASPWRGRGTRLL